jgi:large subunit ribosomal protein L30
MPNLGRPMEKQLKVTLIKSTVRRLKVQKLTVKAMGFHRLHETRYFPDNPAMRGMITRVAHLVKVETVEGQGA